MTDTQLLDGLEEWARRGVCPALLNDDNGHWAVSDEGTQSVATGADGVDVWTSFVVPAGKWRNSVREAIACWLDEVARDAEEFKDDKQVD